MHLRHCYSYACGLFMYSIRMSLLSFQGKGRTDILTQIVGPQVSNQSILSIQPINQVSPLCHIGAECQGASDQQVPHILGELLRYCLAQRQIILCFCKIEAVRDFLSYKPRPRTFYTILQIRHYEFRFHSKIGHYSVLDCPDTYLSPILVPKFVFVQHMP